MVWHMSRKKSPAAAAIFMILAVAMLSAAGLYPLVFAEGDNACMKADVDGNSVVNIFDLAKVGKAFGALPGDVYWNPDADIDEDGQIGIMDLTIMGHYYGTTCSTDTQEACDGIDNDGDGAVDEDYNLSSDNSNCGACGNACGEGESCSNGACIILISSNEKDASKYAGKEAFLVSDSDWKDVLQFVPLTTWTQQEGDDSNCQRGHGTADGVCVYPTLIFHEEAGQRFVDLAAGAVVTASSNVSYGPASYALDNNILTEWNSGSNAQGYLKLDFGEVKQFNRADIFESTEPYFLSIEVSEDDAVYQQIVVNRTLVPGENYAVVRNPIEFSPVSARYVKFVLSDNPAQRTYPNWKTISEIKIYGEEKVDYTSFDADSIIHFLQQYDAGRLTISGNIPQELDNLLIAAPELGAGLDQGQIQRISVNDYLSHWESYKDVVYVEDDYELALMASTYASLLNAPLVIEGSSLDADPVFAGKNVTCVGDVQRTCDQQYGLEELQERYVNETGTDKMMLVNPDDLDMKVEEEFQPEKSAEKFYELYGKTSLASPILASAKHEVIVSTTATDYQVIDGFIQERVNTLMPWIINNSEGINVEHYYPFYNYTIYGYLTAFGAPNAIPAKKYSYTDPSCKCNLSIALDQYMYGDIFRSDSHPDMAVGRIQGITLSDVSGYLARDLFYDEIGRTNRIQFMAKSIYSMEYIANAWTGYFDAAGYDASCSLGDTVYVPPEGGCDVDATLLTWPDLWKDSDVVSFMDHGGPYAAGIKSSDIPDLSGTIVFADACSTCSVYDGKSFCNNAMRKGSLGYMGAVSSAYAWNGFRVALEGIYNFNVTKGESSRTLGQSFSKAYSHMNYYMMTLLGDPTLNLDPDYSLNRRWGLSV
ncbi:MAG: discoidin domain-containing protein [Candidatus Aenigmatarchaeota archaeon]